MLMRLFFTYCLLALPTWLFAQNSNNCSIDFKETIGLEQHIDPAILQEQPFYHEGQLLAVQVFFTNNTYLGQFFRLNEKDWLYVGAEAEYLFSPLDTTYQDLETGGCRRSLIRTEEPDFKFGASSAKGVPVGYRFTAPEQQRNTKASPLHGFRVNGKIRGAMEHRAAKKGPGFFLRYDAQHFYFAQPATLDAPPHAGLMRMTSDSLSYAAFVFDPDTFEELVVNERAALLEPEGYWQVPQVVFDSAWIVGDDSIDDWADDWASQVYYKNGKLQGWGLTYPYPVDTLDYTAELAYFQAGKKVAAFQRNGPHIEDCKPIAYGQYDEEYGWAVVWHALYSDECYQGEWTFLAQQPLLEQGKQPEEGIIAIEGDLPAALASEQAKEGLSQVQLQKRGRMLYQQAGSDNWEKGKWRLEVPKEPIPNVDENAEFSNGPLYLVLERRRQTDLRYLIYLSYEGLMALLPVKN